jgi:hypothetical protein
MKHDRHHTRTEKKIKGTATASEKKQYRAGKK